MGIYSQDELENKLFSLIRSYSENQKRLLYHDFYGKFFALFDQNDEKLKNFLFELENKGFIKVEGSTLPVITFGPNASDWRKQLEKQHSQPGQNIAQTINIGSAHTVQNAGRDMNVFLTENDVENLVKVLKEVIPANAPANSIAARISAILASGNNAMQMIKAVAGLIIKK